MQIIHEFQKKKKKKKEFLVSALALVIILRHITRFIRHNFDFTMIIIIIKPSLFLIIHHHSNILKFHYFKFWVKKERKVKRK